jgi:hypothetical protein
VSYNEKTVKAVVFHELTHAYFNQILITMKNNNQYVSPEYATLRMFPSSRFNVEFIEEGICEYVVHYLGECSPLKDIIVPDNEIDLLDKNNAINNLYCYSVIFLTDFLDKTGIKEGIKILISNNPPTHKEILNMDLYYKRLK